MRTLQAVMKCTEITTSITHRIPKGNTIEILENGEGWNRANIRITLRAIMAIFWVMSLITILVLNLSMNL